MYSLKSEIAVIGAGKISYSLVNALKKSGLNVSSVISRKNTSAEKLARKFKLKNYSDNLIDIPGSCEVFILAVPDIELKNIAADLLKLKLNFEKLLFIHLSGAENISVLKPLQRKNAGVASFHIMQSFPSRAVVDIKNCYAAIEPGNKKSERYLKALSGKLGVNSFIVKSKDKVYYHLAGVYASNFLSGNFSAVEELFNKTGNRGINSPELFLPIINTTLSNIKKSGAKKSLSGPVERGDVFTVKNHVKALKNDKILRGSYIAQTLNLLGLIKKRDKKLSPAQMEIEKYLKRLR